MSATPYLDALVARLAALEANVGDLQRAGRRPSSLGFYVHRSTNQAAIANATGARLSFNGVAQDVGFLPAGWTSGDTFTVPEGGGGVYVLEAECLIVPAGDPWVMTVRLNGAGIGQSSYLEGATERKQAVGVCYCSPSDVLDAWVFNGTGGNVTPTAAVADANSPRALHFAAWRVST